MTEDCATTVGTALQLVGAAYLLFQSWRTAAKLSQLPADVQYNSLAPTVNALLAELKTQFRQQTVGFIFVLAGSAFQIYALAA